MSALKVQDLNPIETTITLNGKEYTLRKFDLLARSWASNEFATESRPDGLFVLADKMKSFGADNFDTLLKCIWHLLKQKSDFGSFDGFCLAVTKECEKTGSEITYMGSLLKAFNYTLGVSELSEDEIGEDSELKKR